LNFINYSAHNKGIAGQEHWSVWLGTEDGGLHIYDCSDSVRVKKNRHKIQHKAPLNSILYVVVKTSCRFFLSLIYDVYIVH